jgi:DNA-directed RNA polymerase subunit RPC12/RpoP
MYAVVGCSACSALWILEGRQETARCPQCGKTHQYKKLKKFVETEDADHAREVRASMLASRGGHAESFAAVDSFGELDSQVERPVIENEELLEGAGIDSEEVAVANETEATTASRKEIVLAAVNESEHATSETITAYAADRGVPEDYVEQTLEKLVRAGELTQHQREYRRL